MTLFDFLRARKRTAFNGEAMLYHYAAIDTLAKFLGDDGRGRKKREALGFVAFLCAFCG